VPADGRSKARTSRGLHNLGARFALCKGRRGFLWVARVCVSTLGSRRGNHRPLSAPDCPGVPGQIRCWRCESHACEAHTLARSEGEGPCQPCEGARCKGGKGNDRLGRGADRAQGVHQCKRARTPPCTLPVCSSDDVRRSHRRGILDNALHALLSVVPYRCRACQRRFHKRDEELDGEEE
jgi:hypothetical protein